MVSVGLGATSSEGGTPMSSRSLVRTGFALAAIAALLVCFGAQNDAAFARGSLGVVLVIDDDSGKPDVGNGREMVPRDPSMRGLSAEGMAAHLTVLGYDVTLETSATSDPATWPDYDFIVSSTCNNTTDLTQTYRDALVAYVGGGGKIIVEGGEVGYNHQTGPFAEQVLHVLDWDTDNAGVLNIDPAQTGHPIANVPNVLPASFGITYSGYGDEDAMEINPDAFIVYGTTTHPLDAGVLVYDNNPNPVSAQIVYYAFNWAAADNRGTADNLLENTAAFLMAEETGPTAGISGIVDLTDTADDSGVQVDLAGPAWDQTFTDTSGYYEFTGLYPGTYSVTATPPAGYFPESDTHSGIFVEDTMVTDIDFTFDPTVLGSVTGTVTLENNPDASGVTVVIVGQGIVDVTGYDGTYTLAGVTPGNITVKASKEGYSTVNRFETLPNGGALTDIDFYLTESGGLILVIDDDYTAARDNSGKEGIGRGDYDRGVSADAIVAHLTTLGYDVTLETSGGTDPATWSDYDLIVSSSGPNTSPIPDAPYRDAIEAWVGGGGKLVVEGGEVGYDAISYPGYPSFAANVLHCYDWDSDNSGGLVIDPGQTSHPIATTPNALPASMAITYVGYGDQDANAINVEAFIVYGTTDYPSDCGILVYDDTPEPTSAQIVYYAFNFAAVENRGAADNMLENTVAFLFAEETGGFGAIVGTADLTDTADDSGTHVVLTGIVNDEVWTGPDGTFQFTGLFAGTYTVTMTPPAGYYPYDTEVPGIVVADAVVDVGTYSFDAIVPGTISGTAQLSDNPDWSGITVEVVGQAVSMVTGSDGLYELTGANPGDLTVKASKADYQSDIQEVFLANGGTITGLDFLLEPGSDEYFEDFEADDGGYYANAGWEWGTPSTGPGGAHSGVNLWGTWIDGNYDNAADWRLESIDVDVSGFANVLLKFWHWYTTESYWDGGNVKLSTDGGATWILIEPVDGYPEDAASTANSGIPGEACYSGTQGVWELAQFNLNAYAGGTVMIRWHFGSDGSVNSYPGWYIDDVGIVDDVVKLPPENLVATGGLENHVPLDWTHPEETPKASIDYNDLSNITGPDAELEIAKRAQIPAADRAAHERPVVKDGRPVIGYHVYRSLTSGGPYTDVSGLIVPSDYDDLDVINDTPYYYTATADYGAFGESDPCTEVSATPTNNPPPVPQNLIATVVGRDVTLDWDAVTAYDLDGYNVYRKMDEGDWLYHATTPVGTETFGENLAVDGIFQYRVTSFDNTVPPAESGPSNIVTVAMGILPPTYLTAESGNDGHIPLEWMPPGTSDFPPYEIIYDDGTNENALALNAANNGLAVRFTPLGYPFTIDTGKWFIDDYSSPTTPLTVRIYDDDGPGGVGGTMLAEATGVAASGGMVWVEHDFATPVTITEGDFYIACMWEVGANPGPTSYVGLDTDGSFEDRTWLVLDGGATWSQDELHSAFPNSEIMIRSIGRGPTPKGAEVVVETYELEAVPRRVEGSSSLTLGQPALFGPRETVNEAPHFVFSQNATKETLEGYNLYRSETSPVPVDPANFIASTAPDVLEYDDWGPGGLGLANGTEYFYVATADYGPDGESGPSGEASAIPENAPPPVPENLIATLVDRDVTLDWDPVVVYDLNSYNIYRSYNYGDFALHGSVPAGTETFGENLPVDGIYKYKVTAVDNDLGESGFSNAVTVAVGILPPRNLRAQSGYDGNVPLTWSEPGGTGGIELNILLVSDQTDGSASPEYYDAVYTHGCETAGLAYTIWDHDTQGEPTLADLQPYNCIFWYTGVSGGTANTHATLSLNEEQVLVDWLTLGDKFLVGSGIWMAWDCIADATNQVQLPSDLFDNHFHLSYPPENFSGWISVTNSWFMDGQVNPVGQDLDYGINWVSGENYPDQLESNVAAAENEVYTWMDPNVAHHQGGISYDGASFKTVLLACPVEQLDGEATQDLLIGNILNWFGGTAKSLDLSMLAEVVPAAVKTSGVGTGRVERATGKSNGIDMRVGAGFYPAPVTKQDNVVAYNLYRSETSPVPVDPANFIGATPHDVLEYVDWGPGSQGLTNDTEYFYTVTADYGPDGESGPANEDSAIPTNAVPPAPEEFAAGLKPDYVRLTWAETHVYDFDYYNVYREQTGGGTKDKDFVMIATGLEVPEYFDVITSEGIYFYYATAVDLDGAESDPSNQDFVVFGVLPPNSLTAHDGPTFVPVTWMAPGEMPEYEISYDDGTNENALALNAADNGLAVRFTPLGYPAAIGTAKWYIDDYSLPTAPLTVRIYDDDGAVAGGTILAEATGVAASGGMEWVEYDFSGASVTITDGDFYVACMWEVGANPGPTCYVGLDTDGSFEDRTWLVLDGGATWSQDELHSAFPNSEIMIRCTVFGPSKGVIASNVGPATEAMETYDWSWNEGDKPYTVEGSSFASLAAPMEIGPRGEPTEHAYFNLMFDPGEEGPENNVVGYNLYKSEAPGVEAIPGNLIATVDNEVYEYIDYDVVIATEYFYAATSLYQGLEESSLSNEDSGTPQDDYVAPAPPTDVTAVNTAGLTVHVEWVDPTENEDGTPLDDLTTLTIYRDDAPVGTANPGDQAYDDTAPTDGEFSYYVTASDEVPNESDPSNSVFVVVGDPGYVQDFEADDGGFTTSGALNDWQWGAPTSGPGSAHSGVNVWGINLSGDYSVNSDSRLSSVAFTAYENCELTFWTWWDTESYYDGWNCKVSTDGGASWVVVTPEGGYPEDAAYSGNAGIPGEPCYSGHDQGFWEQVRVDLSSFGSAGGTSMMFRWHFGSDGSVQYPGPYIDDVVIWDATRAMTDVDDGIPFAKPNTYALKQNRPNPFNPVTEIQFAIPEAGNVRLEVYNLQGQLVKTLVNEARSAGFWSATWDGTNNNGEQVSSGVYFYRIDCNDFGETRKMIILK